MLLVLVDLVVGSERNHEAEIAQLLHEGKSLAQRFVIRLTE